MALWALSTCMFGAMAQNPTQITEIKKRYVTYPFSDPDPIAAAQKLYPYFRFDGFTSKATEKEWTAVILENDYIRVQIMPEIGGKIWSAYDKVNKRDYIYNNGVVKFRDIAMRGPWTSGGIEANYGIIGHTPNTSTPVDYLLREYPDGSASCFIHAFDLLSRSSWTLEIRLEKDKGYFSTRSFWSNSQAIEQPYYTWMNLGVAAGDDLQFLYPGNRYIGHDGDAHPWPMDEQGRDLSKYVENAFGSSKSYHVLGAHSNAFGVYYKNRDYGMGRYALREDKLGKKIFLWSQAGDGQIWEKLLTDKSGQYVEIQSGRLFNQNVVSSSFTPFKQVGFAPYQSDSWTEYWLPFAGIGKPSAIQPSAAIEAKMAGNKLLLHIDPKRRLKDSILVLDSLGAILQGSFIQAQVAEVQEMGFELKTGQRPYYLKIGKDYVDLRLSAAEKQLHRPAEIDPEVAADSAQVKLFEVRDLIRFRQYELAEMKLKELMLMQRPSLPLYLEQAKLAWFKMNYQQCYDYARQALSVDAYQGEANYYYGLAALKIGRENDAQDGFEVASLDPAWRSAAYLQLAKYYYRIKQYESAFGYSVRSLQANGLNIDALQLQCLLQLKYGLGKGQEPAAVLAEHDPFNTFMQFETNKKIRSRQEFASEKIMELAVWYADLNEYERAADVLVQAKQTPETLCWLAWLTRMDPAASQEWIAQAEVSSAAFVFPFREESEAIFQWMKERSTSWKVDYLLALLYRFRNQPQKGQQLLANVQHEPQDFAAYYALKSSLNAVDHIPLAVKEMQQACRVAPDEWRYGLHLVELQNQQAAFAGALKNSTAYHKKFPDNYILTLAHIRTLLLNRDYASAERELQGVEILPFEGATEGHRYFVQAKLMLAYQYILQKKYAEASQKLQESRLWPINLGAGEPYDSEKNELLADWLSAYLKKQASDQEGEQHLLKKIVANKKTKNSYELLLQQIASERLGQGNRGTLSTTTLNESLVEHVRKDALAQYWPELIRKIYFEKDQRMF
ncbi:DUF5107 domain-containing protein [Sphingobacterium sp. N143]|uniref:DUF5107 domain-containing protein n=1 Tax=Sphingobacterium sp. N143 TaxID=2746727 RepID=UPI0025750699|nr:DUF5107 domain-containing protein [Sphingobacterium sp. N143]MDM1295196.1 DUF5107 domain-containing protein [Sphingobacterium sp. N143]